MPRFSVHLARLGLPVFVASCGLLAAAVAHAQSLEPPPRDVRALTIESDVLSTARNVWVWVPPGYATSGVRYPVVYLLDAEVHFRHATALSEFLAYYLRMPDVIVVGVPHPNRSQDLVPADTTPGPFLTFLVREVRRAVDREFRTEPFAVLVGHSLGGLLTVHTAVHQPAAFDAYVAISPSLYWRDAAVVTAAASVGHAAGLDRPLFLALSQGEPPNITASTRRLVEVLEGLGGSGPRWVLREFSGENHLTVPYVALNAAFRWVFDGFSPPLDGVVERIAAEGTLDAIDEHYAAVSARFGYEAAPSDQVIHLVGDRLLQRGAHAPAIALFNRRVARGPDSVAAHDDLARAYEAAGDTRRAREHARRALALAERQQHSLLSVVTERLLDLESRVDR